MQVLSWKRKLIFDSNVLMIMNNKCLVFLTNLWLYLSLFFVAVLTVFSCFRSEEFDLHRDVERLIYENDRPLLLLALLFLLILIIAFLPKLTRRLPGILHLSPRSKAEGYLVMAVAGILSLFFLLTLRSKPYMDCVHLVSIAGEFAHNDFSALSTPDHNSYLYIYAFQIGVISVLELLFRLFGEGNYFAFQLLNIIGVIFIVRSIHEMAVLIHTDDTLVRLTDFFLCFCFPLYINVTFVYGDVLGWSFACCALLCTFRWIYDDRNSHLIGTALLISVGVLLKTNDYIFLIAIVLIILVESVRKSNLKPLLYAALCVIMTIALSGAVKNVYANKAGIDSFPTGAPSACWIAMSMIEDKDFEDGWYNGYNISTFVESGYDPVLSNQIAKEKILERMNLFLHHPRYTARFFLRKFVSAWNDPQFNSQIKIEWSTRHVENLSPLAVSLIEGTGRKVMFHMMNILHFIVFAGSLIWIIHCVRSQNQITRITSYAVLPTLGGILFHLLWETQARYMIPYYVLLFPIAAAGITFAAQALRRNA